MLPIRHRHRVLFRDRDTVHAEDVLSFVDSEPCKVSGELNFVNRNCDLCEVSLDMLSMLNVGCTTSFPTSPCPCSELLYVYRLFCLRLRWVQVAQFPSWQEQRNFLLAVYKPSCVALMKLHAELLSKPDMVRMCCCLLCCCGSVCVLRSYCSPLHTCSADTFSAALLPQGVLLYVDSKGSKGMLTAVAPDKRSVVDAKYPACFRCTIVQNRQQVPVAAVPEKAATASVSADTSHSQQQEQQEEPSDQQASSDFYNKLDRSKVRVSFSHVLIHAICTVCHTTHCTCSNVCTGLQAPVTDIPPQKH